MVKRPPAWLHAHRRDVYSQTGEDGVLQALLELLPEKDRWCVEFGAWDGQHCSNTRHLIEHHAYKAVLIEGDASKVPALMRYCRNKPSVTPLQRWVGFTCADSLDAILAATQVPKDFDFLSIDIDGNDYHAWDATQVYRPKIVCIEYNPTIPSEFSYVQPRDMHCTKGCSLLSLTELASAKGYKLVGALPFNAFFLRSDLYPHLNMASNAPAEVRCDTSMTTHLCTGYDGEVFVLGNRTLPWHGVAFDAQKLQVLPAFLRSFPPQYGPLQSACFRILRLGKRLRRAAALHRRANDNP